MNRCRGSQLVPGSVWYNDENDDVSDPGASFFDLVITMDQHSDGRGVFRTALVLQQDGTLFTYELGPLAGDPDPKLMGSVILPNTARMAARGTQ